MANDFVMKTGTMTPQQVVDNWRQYQPGGANDPFGANSAAIGGEGGPGGIILPQQPAGAAYSPDELASAVQFGYGSGGGNHYGDRGFTKNAAGNYDYSFKDAPPSGVMDDFKDFGVHFVLPALLGAAGAGAFSGAGAGMGAGADAFGNFDMGFGNSGTLGGLTTGAGTDFTVGGGSDMVGGGSIGNTDLSGTNSGTATQYGSPGYTDNTYNPASNPGGMGPGADQYGNYDMGSGISGQMSSALPPSGSFSDWLKNLLNPLGGGSGQGFNLANAIPGLISAGGNLLMANKQNNLAQQYAGYGAPYRDQLSTLMANPSSFFTSPEATAAYDAMSRKLSVGGNPAGDPYKQATITGGLYSLLQGKEDQLARMGGLQSLTAAAPGMAGAGLTSQAQAISNVGSAISNAVNPQQISSLEQLVAALKTIKSSVGGLA